MSKQQASDGFASLNEFRKFESEGDTILGMYCGWEPMEVRNPETGGMSVLPKHMVIEENGGLVNFLHTSQMGLLTDLNVGTTIRIKYTGEIKSGMRRVKTFDIAVPTEALPGILENRRKRQVELAGRIPLPMAVADEDPFNESKVDKSTGEITE